MERAQQRSRKWFEAVWDFVFGNGSDDEKDARSEDLELGEEKED